MALSDLWSWDPHPAQGQLVRGFELDGFIFHPVFVWRVDLTQLCPASEIKR